MPKLTKCGINIEQPSVLNKFCSELQYSAAFGREIRKFAGGVRKYAKFRHVLKFIDIATRSSDKYGSGKVHAGLC